MKEDSCEGTRWAESFNALENPYRRQLLIGLLNHTSDKNTSVEPLSLLTGDVDVETAEVAIRHVHLPKLDKLGFIDWNRQTSEICRGPEWNKIGPVVEMIHTHRDELPDGWLESPRQQLHSSS